MAKNTSAIVVKFNAENHTFKSKQALLAQVKKANDKSAAPDAKSKGLKHMVYLPGLKAPTSLGWTMLHLFDTAPMGMSANKKSKGAYHPAQALSAASKLGAFGVKVESNAPSIRYAQWSKQAAQALAQMSKKSSAKSAKKSSAKSASKKSAKKSSAKK